MKLSLADPAGAMLSICLHLAFSPSLVRDDVLRRMEETWMLMLMLMSVLVLLLLLFCFDRQTNNRAHLMMR